MLFHKLLKEKGLKPGRTTEADIDVPLEVVAPQALEFDEDGKLEVLLLQSHMDRLLLQKDLAKNFVFLKIYGRAIHVALSYEMM
jgi:NitT/TauT family transport system substrate-binding protein